MYPYRSNTNIYQKNTSINTRETNVSVTKNDLKQDKRLLELLEIAQQETMQSLSTFDALIKNTALQQDVETLRNAYLDEVKHLKQLQEISYNVAEANAPDTILQNIQSLIKKHSFSSYFLFYSITWKSIFDY